MGKILTNCSIFCALQCSVILVLSTGTKIIPVPEFLIPVPVLELELELDWNNKFTFLKTETRTGTIIQFYQVLELILELKLVTIIQFSSI